MSRDQYFDNCPGCEPVVFDPVTKRPLPEDSPTMRALRGYWRTTSREQREAFHRVCCNNSRDPKDMAIIEELTAGIQASMEKAQN